MVAEPGTRTVPGLLRNADSAGDESFTAGVLASPQYTRPADFRGWGIPEVLRSGDHGRIARWRRAQALARTMARRPDLVDARGGLSPEERALLQELGAGDYPGLFPGDPLQEPSAP